MWWSEARRPNDYIGLINLTSIGAGQAIASIDGDEIGCDWARDQIRPRVANIISRKICSEPVNGMDYNAVEPTRTYYD